MEIYPVCSNEINFSNNLHGGKHPVKAERLAVVVVDCVVSVSPAVIMLVVVWSADVKSCNVEISAATFAICDVDQTVALAILLLDAAV